MPTGIPYFAWIDPDEETFGPEHLRWDEQIFSFTLTQNEGDPASLTVVVRRPRNVAGNPIGLLGPGRKIWCWFAFDCGPDLVRFRGRLVGVPTSLFEELVTLEFVARPIDLVAQKEALAESLRVLPYYDDVMVDESRRADPEVVLEGYSKIWHYDRETHELTVSDEIDGEDGLVEFDGASEDGKTLYDGLALTLTSGPLTRVDVAAQYTWTQQARGTVDMTNYLVSHWPNEPGSSSIRGAVASFTFSADDWPKAGASLGDGWTVAEASARSVYDLTIRTTTEQLKGHTSWPDGDRTESTINTKQDFCQIPPGSRIPYGTQITKDEVKMTRDSRGKVINFQRDYEEELIFQPLNYTRGTLKAAYAANRQCTEDVSLSVYADVQHILTDPEDGEALRLADLRSVNLTEPIGEGTGAEVPIGDPRRRSYIATERGNQSLEYLIALARANLLKRARVVEISFVPKLARMAEVTLRKNAFLAEPRIGEALGKIIGYSLALDGADGQIKCEVRIGCAIGRGGSAVAAGGEPTYCTIDYCGPDYQQFTGRIVLFDTSIGYEPPASDPNDDGIDFTSVQADDVIAIPLAKSGDKVTFKLKSMTRDFSSDYTIGVTALQIPTGYDLEAS